MIVDSSIFINKYIAKACMELSVILIIEHCIKVIKKIYSVKYVTGVN